MTFKQAHSGNYQPGRTQPIEYIVVHYTANKSDTAKNNVDYFARTVTGTSAHYFVDRNAVMQSVDEGDTAWHCGSDHPRHPYCRNSNSIGIEMCDSVDGVPDDVKSLTVSLVQELMSRYGIDSSHVLRHYDVTGKRCPVPWVDNPAEWMEFKKMLEGDDEEVTQDQFNSMMETYLAQRDAQPASGWAVPHIQEAIDAGVITDVGGSIERPQGFVTREELATVAAALSKK